jgi:hypothetical protein
MITTRAQIASLIERCNTRISIYPEFIRALDDILIDYEEHLTNVDHAGKLAALTDLFKEDYLDLIGDRQDLYERLEELNVEEEVARQRVVELDHAAIEAILGYPFKYKDQ